MAYKFNPLLGAGLDEVGAGGGSTSPGGSDTQVQFNDGGSFGGSADLTWDDTAKELGVGGDINLDDGGTYSTTLQMVTATANRVISFPDATGTVALVAGSSGQLTYNNAGAQAGDANLTWNATTGLALGKPLSVNIAGAASTPSVSFLGTWFTGGTSTTTKPKLLIEPSGTTSTGWSTSGTGLGINAASGFTGNLLDLQVNGTSRFRVAANASVSITEGNSAGRAAINLPAYSHIQTNNGRLWFQDDVGTIRQYFEQGLELWNNGYIGICPSTPIASTADVRLYRDTANTFAQRNGTNAQTYRLYNTYTDASNYERVAFKWDTNTFKIEPEAAGTGTLRSLAFSANGAASTPPVSLTGTWFSGGTSTTTKPALLIEPSGTTSTAWSTSGTGLGVNAPSGFAGNLLDLQVNGTSIFSVGSVGNTSSAFAWRIGASSVAWAPYGGATAFGAAGGNPAFTVEGALGAGIPSAALLWWASSATSGAYSLRDVVLARDAAGILAQRNGTNAQTLRVYGTYTDASNHVRGSLSATSTAVTLAAETAGTGADNIPLNLTAAGTGTVKVNSVAEVAVSSTVAGLPATPAVGMLTRVTDATAPAVGSTVTGGGAAAALVWWNGAAWTVIGV
jgi:hypothetical protein